MEPIYKLHKLIGFCLNVRSFNVFSCNHKILNLKTHFSFFSKVAKIQFVEKCDTPQRYDLEKNDHISLAEKFPCTQI